MAVSVQPCLSGPAGNDRNPPTCDVRRRDQQRQLNVGTGRLLRAKYRSFADGSANGSNRPEADHRHGAEIWFFGTAESHEP